MSAAPEGKRRGWRRAAASWVLIVACGGSMPGCAVLAGVGILLGTEMIIGAAVTPVFIVQAERERERCLRLLERGEIVTASDDGQPAFAGIAADRFEPAIWRIAFGEDDVAPAGTPVDSTRGVLLVSDRSAHFVAADGLPGVRIPLRAVRGVDLRLIYTVTGENRELIVRSCGERSDIFAFMRRDDPLLPDGAQGEAAAKSLRAHIAALAGDDR